MFAFGNLSLKRACCLVWSHESTRSIQSNQDITSYTCRQMNLSFKVKFDSNRQSGSFQVAFVVDRASEEVA